MGGEGNCKSPSTSYSTSESFSKAPIVAISSRLNTLDVSETSGQSNVPLPSLHFGSIGSTNKVSVRGQEANKERVDQMVDIGKETQTAFAGETTAVLRKLFSGSLLENFTVDNSAYTSAQIRATFYPKFDNEKSDQEIRTRMTELVDKGLANLEVSLKHSGSLFMYAGHEGGAYAKNSYGNIYTAVGVFVLERTFREAWGSRASKKQTEFNEFLERNRMCISLELVTAVLGDHGQRPREDYVVVTAVAELGSGKSKFYSTPNIIAFCRKWRLPTNHVWLFSTRKSVMSFFASYDALREEGTATTVCRALNEVADISAPGSKDHTEVQGEILEGLVARIVSHESSKHMEQILRDYPPPPVEGDDQHLGPSLREICATIRIDEKQRIKALLESVGPSFCPNYLDWFGDERFDSHSRNADRSVLSKFLQAKPANFSTAKLQELVRLMKEKRLPVAFKCYHNFHKINAVASDDLHYRMVIHVHSDSAFIRYQKQMRHKQGLWPLYRGKYWGKVSEERRKKPYSIMLADKNAPNEEVWRQIEDMCRSTKASAIPVVPDSEGTESNPFSFDALAVFMLRVLQRDNHPGNLDKSSPNAGYVLLMFYHLYDGKSRNKFETELIERFGSLVKIPLLVSDRSSLPEAVSSTLDKGIDLYRLHTKRHRRLDSTKGTYTEEWVKWEKKLRDTLLGNSEYLNSIQVPFEASVGKVVEQLKSIAKGENTPPSTEKRRSGTVDFAAVTLPVSEILELLENFGKNDSKIAFFLKDKDLKSSLTKAHVTLAHNRSHGVTAVANYGPYLHQNVPIHMTAILFSENSAAIEVDIGLVEGEKLVSKNEWPHVTLWTAERVAAKEANMLPHLLTEGKAVRVKIDPPVTITGFLEFY